VHQQVMRSPARTAGASACYIISLLGARPGSHCMPLCACFAGRVERAPVARGEAAGAGAPARAALSGAGRADAGDAGEQREPRAGDDRGWRCGAGGVAAAAGALSRRSVGTVGPGERAPAACSTPGETARAAEGGLAPASAGCSPMSSSAACGRGGGGSASGEESAGRAAPGSAAVGARDGGACAQARPPPAAGSPHAIAFARARLPDSSDSEGDHTPASGPAGHARGNGIAALRQCSGAPAAHEPCDPPEGTSHGVAARIGTDGGAGSPPGARSGAAPDFERARLSDSSDSSGSSMGGRDARTAERAAGGGGAGVRDAGGIAHAQVAAGGRPTGRVAFKRVRMDDSSDECEGPGAGSRPGRRVLPRAGPDAQRAAPGPASPGAARAPRPASPGAGDERGGSGCPAEAGCAARQAAAPHAPAPPLLGSHASTRVLPAAGAHASAPALLLHSASAPGLGAPGAGQPRCEARGQCLGEGLAAGAGPAGAGAAVVGSAVSPAAGAPPPACGAAAAAPAAAPPLVEARSDTELRVDGQLTTWTRARPACLAARSCCEAVCKRGIGCAPWHAALRWPAQTCCFYGRRAQSC